MGSVLGGSFATASTVFAEMKALASSSYAVMAASSASTSVAKAKETGGAKNSGAARLKDPSKKRNGGRSLSVALHC